MSDWNQKVIDSEHHNSESKAAAEYFPIGSFLLRCGFSCAEVASNTSISNFWESLHHQWKRLKLNDGRALPDLVLASCPAASPAVATTGSSVPVMPTTWSLLTTHNVRGHKGSFLLLPTHHSTLLPKPKPVHRHYILTKVFIDDTRARLAAPNLSTCSQSKRRQHHTAIAQVCLSPQEGRELWEERSCVFRTSPFPDAYPSSLTKCMLYSRYQMNILEWANGSRNFLLNLS